MLEAWDQAGAPAGTSAVSLNAASWRLWARTVHDSCVAKGLEGRTKAKLIRNNSTIARARWMARRVFSTERHANWWRKLPNGVTMFGSGSCWLLDAVDLERRTRCVRRYSSAKLVDGMMASSIHPALVASQLMGTLTGRCGVLAGELPGPIREWCRGAKAIDAIGNVGRVDEGEAAAKGTSTPSCAPGDDGRRSIFQDFSGAEAHPDGRCIIHISGAGHVALR